MKVQSLTAWGRTRLQEAMIDDPIYDAGALYRAYAQVSLSAYAAHLFDEVDINIEQSYRAAIERRCLHEPLQRILGIAPFMGDDYEVNAHTLIPRFDSEILVLEAEKYLKEKKALGKPETLKVLDMCTGSGCLLVSLLKRNPGITGFGSDISEGAVETARRNAARLGVSATFGVGDLFSHITEAYDIILSNPPYIKRDDLPQLDEEVRAFDPMAALDGGEDGLDFYRRIVDKSADHLKDNGVLLFEIGFDEGQAVSKLLENAGFRDVRIIKDLAGQDRVVTGVR